jgi:hypothetical protein
VNAYHLLTGLLGVEPDGIGGLPDGIDATDQAAAWAKAIDDGFVPGPYFDAITAAQRAELDLLPPPPPPSGNGNGRGPAAGTPTPPGDSAQRPIDVSMNGSQPQPQDQAKGANDHG